jgi:hypothetical protein
MNDRIDDTHNMAEETQNQVIELKDTVRGIQKGEK